MTFKVLDRFLFSKDFFQLNLAYLFLVGLWPDEKWLKKQAILYKMYQNTLFCFSITFLVITGVKTYQIRNDIIYFLANIDKSIVAYNYFFKVIIFLKRREELKQLVDDISLSGDRVKEENRKRMIDHLVLVTGFNSVLMLVFSMLGMQGIVCSILIYLCDQLKTLQSVIKNFEFCKENERVSRQRFKKIVQKHIRLMRYSTSMEAMFSEYFLIQNLAVTMELCLNAMMVTMVGTSQKIVLAGFLGLLGLALLNAYIYCKLGNQLIDQSEGISFAAYSADWSHWPLDLQKDVLLIISASQRAFQMSAGGIAAISMQTYGTALYNGYSIFAVLNDVVEN